MYSDKLSTQTKRLFWARHVSDWAQSGLSKRKFCLQRGLVYSTFGYWSRKLMPAAQNTQPDPDPAEKTETPQSTEADHSAQSLQTVDSFEQDANETESAIPFLEVDSNLCPSLFSEPAALTLTFGAVRIDISPHASPSLVRAVLKRVCL